MTLCCSTPIAIIFATGRFGRPVENIHIRIVVPRPVDGAKLASNQITYKRDLAGYISERDLQQLYMKSIETPDIRNADGVPWHLKQLRQIVQEAAHRDAVRDAVVEGSNRYR